MVEACIAWAAGIHQPREGMLTGDFLVVWMVELGWLASCREYSAPVLWEGVAEEVVVQGVVGVVVVVVVVVAGQIFALTEGAT